ncbi:hypothetical protein PRIPAC_83949 [Pristionchus pacificus]|uniref:Uncharacterized protein n=1 Tax=Pristionchus pacificus TaxID=54126 RepID=A0A2A6BLT0_PRIPA|nr:hypothetical protein PRIPAC_83949 [Pristionchus pacificus]|eukprot:PDM66859.1 hypothetical protein PRIPAC_48276 [Pristionchus pacificus]
MLHLLLLFSLIGANFAWEPTCFFHTMHLHLHVDTNNSFNHLHVKVRPKRCGKTKSDRSPSSSSPSTVQKEQVNTDSQPLNSSAKTAVSSTSTPASTRTPLARTDGRAVDASPVAKSSKDPSTSAEKAADKDGPSKSSTEDNRAAGKTLAASATATGTNRKIGTSPEVKGGTRSTRYHDAANVFAALQRDMEGGSGSGMQSQLRLNEELIEKLGDVVDAPFDIWNNAFLHEPTDDDSDRIQASIDESNAEKDKREAAEIEKNKREKAAAEQNEKIRTERAALLTKMKSGGNDQVLLNDVGKVLTAAETKACEDILILTSKIKDKDKRFADLKLEYGDKFKRYADQQKKAADLSRKLVALHKECEDTVQRMNSARSKLDENYKKIADIEEAENHIQDKIERAKQRVASASREFEEIQSRLQAIQRNKSNIAKALSRAHFISAVINILPEVLCSESTVVAGTLYGCSVFVVVQTKEDAERLKTYVSQYKDSFRHTRDFAVGNGFRLDVLCTDILVAQRLVGPGIAIGEATFKFDRYRIGNQFRQMDSLLGASLADLTEGNGQGILIYEIYPTLKKGVETMHNLILAGTLRAMQANIYVNMVVLAQVPLTSPAQPLITWTEKQFYPDFGQYIPRFSLIHCWQNKDPSKLPECFILTIYLMPPLPHSVEMRRLPIPCCCCFFLLK